MARWLVALVLGLAALGGVYFLWQRESARQTEVQLAPHQEQPALAPPGAGARADTAPSQTLPGAETGNPSDGAAGPSSAAPSSSASAEGIIAVDEPWANETAAGRDSTAVYMLLTNTSQIADRVAAVSSPDSADAMIHETRIDAKSVATMTPATHVDLDPGVPLVFEPGGLHIMLIGLKHPVKLGDTLTVVLTFQHSGVLRVKVPVGEQQTDGDSVQP